MLNEGNVFPNPKPIAPFCLQIASPSSSSSRRAAPPQLPETVARSKSCPSSSSEDASLLPSGDSSLDFLVRPSLQELCLRNCADFSGKLLSELGRYCKDLRACKVLPPNQEQAISKITVLPWCTRSQDQIFRLEPKIGESEQPENVFHQAEVTTKKRVDKLRTLTVLYSTKTNIRRDLKYDTLRQTEDPETQQSLDYKLKEIMINKEALQAIASTTNARNIPPYDLGATTSDMEYTLNKIILEEEWDYLLDISELAQAGAEVKQDVYPNKLEEQVQNLSKEKDVLAKHRGSAIQEAHLWRSELAKAREHAVILEGAVVRAEEKVQISEGDAESRIKEAMEKETKTANEKPELHAYINILQEQLRRQASCCHVQSAIGIKNI